jgi:hypothetical protein
MPVELDKLNEIFTIRGADRLREIEGSLIAQRLVPSGYTGALVELQTGAQPQRASQ